jgi:hypothetical protein
LESVISCYLELIIYSYLPGLLSLGLSIYLFISISYRTQILIPIPIPQIRIRIPMADCISYFVFRIYLRVSQGERDWTIRFIIEGYGHTSQYYSEVSGVLKG